MKENEEIKSRLLSMVERDQEMRQRAARGEVEWDESVDKENTKELKEILKKIGWPTISKVGREASKAAWLLAQHADADPDFQKECLELIIEAIENSDAERSQVGYLTDRILLKEGKKQLYGTQLRKNDKDEFEPLPLEDPENVNKRRKEVGLGTIEDYVKGFNSPL